MIRSNQINIIQKNIYIRKQILSNIKTFSNISNSNVIAI